MLERAALILRPLPTLRLRLRLRLMLIRLSRLPPILHPLLAATMTVMTPRWAARSLIPPILLILLIPPTLRLSSRRRTN